MIAAASASKPVRLHGCECCGLVSSSPAEESEARGALRCPRCASRVRPHRPMSLQRTWAYLVASALLYVPANLLPIMSTTNVLGHIEHTIAGGIAVLWNDGAWGLAIIVFVASLAVPLLKISALALLAWSVRHAPGWRRLERARLFRIVEAVGRWSMLDVYVVVLLGAMVNFGRFASVQPEPGLVAFALVVVLTVLAARSFDPRLIWREGSEHD